MNIDFFIIGSFLIIFIIFLYTSLQRYIPHLLYFLYILPLPRLCSDGPAGAFAAPRRPEIILPQE